MGIRHFEETGEKFETKQGMMQFSYFPPMLSPQLGPEITWVGKRKEGQMFGRKDGWKAGRRERLLISIFSMNTYIDPRVKYYKMCPKIKALDHLTNQGEKKAFQNTH